MELQKKIIQNNSFKKNANNDRPITKIAKPLMGAEKILKATDDALKILRNR